MIRLLRKPWSAFDKERFVSRKEREHIRDVKRDYAVFLEHGLMGLRHVSEALDREGLPWYLSYGSLLGWRRENALIPHDIDIVLPVGTDKDRVNRALVSAGMKLTERIRYWGKVTNENYWGHQTFVDLFYLHEVDGAAYVFAKWKECCVLLAEPPLSLVRTKFHDVDMWAPEDVDSYLAALYGPNWRQRDPDWDWLLQPNVHAIRGNPLQRARCKKELRRLQRARRERLAPAAA